VFPQAAEHARLDAVITRPTGAAADGEIRGEGHFPNDEAAKKLLYLATKNVAARWAAPQHYWNLALHQFMIRFENRLPA
jgi:transposase-like protein